MPIFGTTSFSVWGRVGEVIVCRKFQVNWLKGYNPPVAEHRPFHSLGTAITSLQRHLLS